MPWIEHALSPRQRELNWLYLAVYGDRSNSTDLYGNGPPKIVPRVAGQQYFDRATGRAWYGVVSCARKTR